MPLTVTAPAETVTPPPLIIPAQSILVPDTAMIAALTAGGYTVTKGVTPPPPPIPGALRLGVYHGNDQIPPFPVSEILDYCDNNAQTFTMTPARVAYFAGHKAMVKVGDPTAAQCAAVAEVLINAGYPDADVPHLWEENQDVWETWNEKKYTAAQSQQRFLAQCAAMDAVPGAKFNHWWCPNLGQAGNQAAGRNQLDTWPGIGPNGNIGIAPDGYFQASDGSDIIGQLAPFEALAKSAGARFGGLCETGPNNGQSTTPLDIPNACTALLTHAAANGWEFVMFFCLKSGGSFNSDLGPKSITAVQQWASANLS